MDEFPHNVTFQRENLVPDGGGGYKKDEENPWVDVFTTEAHVQPINSNQFIQAQQLQNPINHKIFYPHQEGITGSMRALWNDSSKTLALRSNPLDQGGMGEILMVKAELK